MSRLPPSVKLIHSTETEWFFEDRLPKKLIVVLTVMSLVATLAMFFCAAMFRSQIALLIALALACIDAFAVALTVIALRALYRVRFDLSHGRVFVSDRRGIGHTAEWEGDLQEIREVVTTRNGLAIIWEGGEPGPILILPEDEAKRLRRILSKA